MLGFSVEMTLLPLRLLWRGVCWMVRRMRRRKGFRSMAVPAFPHQRPPLDSAVSRVGVPGPGARPGPAASRDAATVGTDIGDPVVVRDMDRSTRATPYDEAVGDPDYVLASFHTREGDGFRIVFHFLLKKQQVRRSVWLDFNRLALRMGRDRAWAMRARLGNAQLRYIVDQPTRPWGRLELPTAWLAVDSTRGQKARTFMLETLDAVSDLIDAGGIDLVSGKYATIPMGDPRPAAVSASTGTSGRSAAGAGSSRKPRSSSTQCEMFTTAPSGRGGTAIVPTDNGNDPVAPEMVGNPETDGAQDGLPPGVQPEHVCTGFLIGTGITERTDANGRQYRIFYADVDVDGKVQRQTGADLERALEAAQAMNGVKVRLQHLGHVPVNGGRHKRKVWHATVLRD